MREILVEELLTKGTGAIMRWLLDHHDPQGRPSAFVTAAYNAYIEKEGEGNASRNGRVYELLICEMLARHGIVPFYYQAEFERVPNAAFDILLYDLKRPVILTAKTSLRERYKQADLEGFALKQVYRNAESHLLTREGKEVAGVKKKIEEGDVSGLASCINTESDEFDDFIEKLKQERFSVAEEVLPVKKGKIIEK